MGENSKTPPGAKALISALDARIEEIATQGQRLMEEFSKLDATARVMMKQLTALRKEQADLEAMKRRYLGRPTKKEAQVANDHRPGATGAVLGFLQSAPGQRLPIDELVQRVETAIKAGSVRTQTGDARKLASSVVGNLVRAGRLRRKGDDVMFPEEKRVAEEKTTVVM